MARNGYRVFDSDMHVYDAQDLGTFQSGSAFK